MKRPFVSRRLTRLWGKGLLTVVICTGILASAQTPETEESESPGAVGSEEPVTADRQSRFREVLALADWDESRLSKFADGEPMTVDEQLEVWRFIERLTTLDPAWMQRRHGLEVTARDLTATPDVQRGGLIRLRGQARHYEIEKPSPEDRREFSIGEFYRTTIDVDGTTVVVTTPRIPERWNQLESLDEPVELAGVFVKTVKDPMGAMVPQLVATEIAWFPTKVVPPTVNYGMSVLGILEVDVSQLDRLVQRRPLTRHDAPAFYQVLEGMGASQVSQLQGAADRQLRQMLPKWEGRLANAIAVQDKQRELLARTVIKEVKEGNYSIAPFFNTPREQVGQIASFEGTVRSALRVEVEPQTASRHGGLDHYFQLAIFTPDSQSYPVFFCVRELPETFPLGDDVDVPVRIAGFFLKMWQYHSRAREGSSGGKSLSEETARAIQAPLFVGVAPQIVSPVTDDRAWGYVAAGGVVTLLGVVWLIEWIRARKDRKYAATTLARVQRSTLELNFDQLMLEETSAPQREEVPEAERARVQDRNSGRND